ncbi:MAG: amidase family protein, partial [Hyphomicrobiaceae bacterium]
MLGPLHGVPLAHKDMYYRAGKVCTAGSRIRKEFKPAYSATVIERL